MPTVSSESRYIRPDGTEGSNRSQDALCISEGDLILFCQSYSSRIPPGYFLGVAQRESGMIGDQYVTNEHDTDYQDDGSTRETYGIFQMNKTEALKAHVIPTADALIDPENNIKCAAINFELNLDRILEASNFTAINEDVWRYLAWGHNAGIGDPVKSIQRFGLDWQAAISRDQNEWFMGRLVPYTDAIVEQVRRSIPLGAGESNTYEEENLGLVALGVVAVGWMFRKL